MDTDRPTPQPPATGQSPFTSLQREIERVFDDFSHGWPFRAAGATALSPRIDMKETDGAVEISAELPGLEEADIDVSVTGRTLRISGEKKTETRRDEGDFHLTERSYGRFARSLALPFAPDADTVEASFRNGVLTLSIPKPPELSAGTKKIAVKTAHGKAGKAAG